LRYQEEITLLKGRRVSGADTRHLSLPNQRVVTRGHSERSVQQRYTRYRAIRDRVMEERIMMIANRGARDSAKRHCRDVAVRACRVVTREAGVVRRHIVDARCYAQDVTAASRQHAKVDRRGEG